MLREHGTEMHQCYRRGLHHCRNTGLQHCDRPEVGQQTLHFTFSIKFHLCIARCHIVYEKDCRSEQEEKCQTVTETITQQQCQMINEKICNTINEQSCNTVSPRRRQQSVKYLLCLNLFSFEFPALSSATPGTLTFICPSIIPRD